MQPLLGALASFLLPLLSPDTQVTQQDSSYERLLAAITFATIAVKSTSGTSNSRTIT